LKSDATYLRHILEMVGRIEAAANAGEATFLASQLHQDAVLRNLHTVTETTQRLSAELKSSYPEVEWVKLAAFRNVLVHDYLGIDIELVWTVVSRDIPELKSKVLQILEEIT
jgi:uncharacterized protein with HEPN domain